MPTTTKQSSTNIPVSFEFFPPKTPIGMEKLIKTAQHLMRYNPQYVSVTFGAGGSSCSKTYDTVKKLKQNIDCEVVPHLSCINLSKQDILKRLDRHLALGVKRIVALRGDRASGSGIAQGEFNYGADLVKLIREHCGDQLEITVAAYPESHPESSNMKQEIDFFKSKVDQGANSAITQYFYNIEAYQNYCNLCVKNNIDIQIIPGIMPIYSLDNLKRFSRMCGAEIPRWLEQSLLPYQDDVDAQRQIGAEHVARLCQQLVASGAPSLHFYSLNQASVCDVILS